MLNVNIHEAKTNLSKLIAAAEAGERVIISRAGKPVAQLDPIKKINHKSTATKTTKAKSHTLFAAVKSEKEMRKPGALRGKIWMSDDFDAPLPDSFWLGEESN